MKANSEKEKVSFYLPALSMNSPPYEEFVYHQNKFIVYSHQSNKRSPSKLSSSKTSAFPSRPNTTATFNKRFSPNNQLSRNRNQESIDKFIETHQKINSILYESNNTLKKIKVHHKLHKNYQSLTSNQFFTKKQLDSLDFTKIEDIKFERSNHNHFEQSSSIIKPEEKLINEISMSKNRTPEEKENERLMKSIKSLGKLQTERSLIEEKLNTNTLSSIDRELVPLEIKAKNHFPLRKSVSMAAKETSRFLKKSELYKNVEEIKIEEEAKKEPEIKEENLSQKDEEVPVQSENKDEEIETIEEQKKSDLEELFDPKYIYKLTSNTFPIEKHNEEDTQTKPSRKVDDEESSIIKAKCISNEIDVEKTQNEAEMIQIIVDENMREMEERLLNEDLTELDQELSKIHKNSEISENQNFSQLSQSKEQSSLFEIKPAPSKFLKKKKEKKKMIVKRNENQEFIETNADNLKRAKIIDYLNDHFYKNVKDLYWKVVTQEKRNFTEKPEKEKFDETQQFEKSYQSCQINNQDNFLTEETNNSFNEKVEFRYVDSEFPHEQIEISKDLGPISWLYFAPSQKSSLFPKELKLPEHYVQKSTKKELPLICLLNCLLNINPKIISRLIEPAYNNVFSVWLNIKGIFQPIFVDGYLPYDSKLNSIYGHSEEFLWVAVLIKAVAKIFCGYTALEGLSFEDWSKILLGFELETLEKPGYDEIKKWGEEEFDEKVQEYFKKAQMKSQSFIIIREKESNCCSIIKSIENNRIRFTDCDSVMRKHEISLFELLLDKNYELILTPKNKLFYHRSSEFESFSDGNIVNFQLKVTEDKSWVKMITSVSEIQRKDESPMNLLDLERRILIYEIPLSFKKHQKKEMILKYVFDNKVMLKSFNESLSKNILLDIHLPELKKGIYKVFIECGNIKVNDYLESQEQNINPWLNTEESMIEDKIRFNNREKQSKIHQCENKSKNFITFTSNNRIEIQTGESLIINSEHIVSQNVKDENYFFPQVKLKASQKLFEESQQFF